MTSVSRQRMNDDTDVPPAPDPPEAHPPLPGTSRFPMRATQVPSKPPAAALSLSLSELSYKRDALTDAYGAHFDPALTQTSMNQASRRRDKGACTEPHRLMYFTGGCVFSTVFCFVALVPLCGWRARNDCQRQQRLFYCLGTLLGLVLFAAIATVVVLLFLGVYREGWGS